MNFKVGDVVMFKSKKCPNKDFLKHSVIIKDVSGCNVYIEMGNSFTEAHPKYGNPYRGWSRSALFYLVYRPRRKHESKTIHQSKTPQRI